jgi:hypothetical protein
MVGTLYEYCSALLVYWLFLIPGGLFTVDTTLEYLWKGYRQWLDRFISREARRKLVVGTALAGVFLAGFLAWKDEHDKVVEEGKEVSRLRAESSGASATKQELAETRKELAALMPRWLTARQKEQIADRLRAQPRVRYRVHYLARAEDGLEYALQFDDVFTKAGWEKRTTPEVQDYGQQRLEGIFIQVNETGSVSASPVAQLLADAFREAEVKEWHFTNNFGVEGDEQVLLIIGTRPYPGK